jgi:hypothetical protein
VVNQCRQKLRYRKLRQTLSLENLAGRWLGKLASAATNPATIAAERQESELRFSLMKSAANRIRRLYRCQLICIRETLDAQNKFWASSDLEADLVPIS